MFTLIAGVVCPPGDHKYEVPPDAVSVTLSPGRRDVDPLALIVALTAGETVTFVAIDVLEHPALFVTLTVYEPALDTLMD